MTILRNDWHDYVGQEFSKEYYVQLREFLKHEYANEVVYPPMHDLFNALHLTPYKDVKVVILGQDPYHGPNQAHGLSFSVKPDVKTPPSLKNMYKELEEDIGCQPPEHGFLESWANQGVLLLNTVLSVRQKQPGSHQGKGWEVFTNNVIATLNKREKPVAFVLWGKHAQAKLALIDESKHFIIQSPHPSPFSAHRGFFGSRPFSKINEWLVSIEESPIDWQLPLTIEGKGSNGE
ncbi:MULTISPECIES: uracil-DNA glycosylase [Shouchella]|uniref:Uracil-DNA glycosylase n=2 Tax=Shouchella TaxID=2893057 RepID=A0ABY7WBX3_9BACI|nr:MULTISPECIES: uracil-DNA glycosylase [Shouchella]MED4128228.1 uracil-DNA glycosylase [Shouchella miscanthi]WDF05128.1 uracil-DNA glycosylase [Shouchella hunanensis]